jgi:transposase
MIDIESIRRRFLAVAPFLDERGRRVLAAAEAKAAGLGGISAVAKATGVARSTIRRGLADVAVGVENIPGRVRRPGGGRRSAERSQAGLLEALDRLVDGAIRGDPESPLRWVSRSQRRLSRELAARGFRASQRTVARLLRGLGFSLQANRKTREGGVHPDRDEQFQTINRLILSHQADGQPAISVDTKKKELVGDVKNGGRELRPTGEPEAVRVHDVEDKGLGKVVPYGVYDIANNTGWVRLGVDNDTAAFAVETIRRWWETIGRARHPGAGRLLVTADSGGSNSPRIRLWKRELQRLADDTGLAITVAHLPPGTSKWNKIEHRLFAFISMNWRGKPLVSHQVILQLIGSTKNDGGLEVACELDLGTYPKGLKVSHSEMAALNIERAEFRGEWNYTIRARPSAAVEQ